MDTKWVGVKQKIKHTAVEVQSYSNLLVPVLELTTLNHVGSIIVVMRLNCSDDMHCIELILLVLTIYFTRK